MARILIVGGGCRGLSFAARMTAAGHAVRASTRSESRRAAIEASGAECWIGTPARLATLRGALEGVTIACWMLAGASGPTQEVLELHSSRLRFFIEQVIDTTVRGLIYDAWPDRREHPPPSAETARAAWPARERVAREALAGGERLARSLAQLNAIPLAVLSEPTGGSRQTWLEAAGEAVEALLGPRS